MNSKSIISTALREAEMSSSAFSGAIQQADVDRVLVGFEFEFCMPNQKINEILKGDFTTDSEERIFQDLKQSPLFKDYNNGGEIDISQINSFTKAFNIKPDFEYSTMKASLKAYIDMVIEKCKTLFYEIPEEFRARISRIAKRRLAKKLTTFDNFRNRVKLYKYDAVYAATVLRYRYEEMIYLDQFVEYARTQASLSAIRKTLFMMQSLQYDKLTIVNLLAFVCKTTSTNIRKNPENYLDIVTIPEARKLLQKTKEHWQQRTGRPYDKFAAAVSELCSDIIGKSPVIFQSYHAHKKNLVDWYIEPDGSLNPESNQQSGELVSPPMSPVLAMEMLGKFRQMASAGEFSASKNQRTGLHINISIPKKIDPLKLAMFAGDEYILQQFGRENYIYAENVIQQLQRRLKMGSGVSSHKKISMDFRTDSDKAIDRINKIAKSIMSSHTASISGSNSKYLSFRSVGFDYLSDVGYSNTVAAVGRFVRAIIIASDPDAYREEYLKKLQQLIEKTSPTTSTATTDESSLTQFYRDIKVNGVPAIQATIYVSQRNSSLLRLKQPLVNSILQSVGVAPIKRNYIINRYDYTGDYSSFIIAINQPMDEQQKQELTDRLANSKLPSNPQSTAVAVRDAHPNYTRSVTITGTTIDSLNHLKNITATLIRINDAWGSYVGWALIRPTRISNANMSPSLRNALSMIKTEIINSISSQRRKKPNLPEEVQENNQLSSNKPIYYFAYGMLTDPRKMMKLNAKKIGRAALSDFKLELMQHANVIKDPGSTVEGVLWKIDQEALEVLDAVEGYPVYYNRINVQVNVDGRSVNSEVYVMTSDSRERSYQHGYPTQRYINDMLNGYRSSNINMNQLKIAVDELHARIDNEGS